MAIDLEEELKKAGGNPAATGGQPFGPAVPTLGQGLTGMSSAISGIGVSNPPPAAAPVNENYGNEGRSVPVPITKDRPGIVVDNNFNVAGKEYSSAPTSQPGVQRITAPGTSPLYTNIERGAASRFRQTLRRPQSCKLSRRHKTKLRSRRARSPKCPWV